MAHLVVNPPVEAQPPYAVDNHNPDREEANLQSGYQLAEPAMSKLGHRLGVSRSYVRKVLKAAEERAFLFGPVTCEKHLVLIALGRMIIDRFIADRLASS